MDIKETRQGRKAARAAMKRQYRKSRGYDVSFEDQLQDMYPDIDEYFDGGYDPEGGRYGHGAWVVYDEVEGRFVDSGVSEKGPIGKLKAYHYVNSRDSRNQKALQKSYQMMESLNGKENPFDMSLEDIGEENVPIRGFENDPIREAVRCIIKEELTKSDKKEIEKIAKKQATKIVNAEIEKAVGKDLKKTVQKEVEVILKDKATKKEIADISKSVIKKLYSDLAFAKQHIIDQIKV